MKSIDHDTLWALFSMAIFSAGVFTGACAHRGFLDYRAMYFAWRARRATPPSSDP